MNKHLPHDLAQMQSLPLESKIIMTQQRIRQWYEYWDGNVYVSFSGGKDSTVLKHIIDSMYDDVPALFVNTGLEYPEIQKFAKSQKNVTVVRPKMRFDEVIKKYGYPVISKDVAATVRTAKYNKDTYRFKKLSGTATDKNGNYSMYNMPKWAFLMDAPFETSSKCCDVMKKRPVHQYEKETGRKPFIGTMAQESRNRYVPWLKNGCNAFKAKRPSSQPLSFWTEQDILHYIKKYNVPYCSVYGDIVVDEKVDGENVLQGQINLIDYLECYEDADKLKTTGCNRTGCIFCMFGCHIEKEPNRFQRLKETHPKQYAYCIGGGEYSEIRVFNFKGEEIKLKHCTREQIEKWANANRDNIRFKIEYGKWQPNKEGLGLGEVLDYIGVNYE